MHRGRGGRSPIEEGPDSEAGDFLSDPTFYYAAHGGIVLTCGGGEYWYRGAADERM